MNSYGLLPVLLLEVYLPKAMVCLLLVLGIVADSRAGNGMRTGYGIEHVVGSTDAAAEAFLAEGIELTLQTAVTLVLQRNPELAAFEKRRWHCMD